MIRAVLDTNILLRMAAGGVRSHLNRLWRDQRFAVLMSLATLTELRTVAARPVIQTYLPLSVSQSFCALLETNALLVQPDLRAPTCRDPQDTALIATAVGGRADFLVTADPDLLDDPQLIDELAKLGVRVLRASEFVTILLVN